MSESDITSSEGDCFHFEKSSDDFGFDQQNLEKKDLSFNPDSSDVLNSTFLFNSDSDSDQNLFSGPSLRAYHQHLLLEFVKKGVSFEVLDIVLRANRDFGIVSQGPLSHKTLIRQSNTDLNFDYVARCDCGRIISIPSSFLKSETRFRCPCKKEFLLKDLLKSRVSSCSLSLKNQIIETSKHFKRLKDLPTNKSQPLKLDLILTTDEIGLSDSSPLAYYCLFVFIDNIPNRNEMNKLHLMKSMCLVDKKSLIGESNEYRQADLELILRPFIKEFLELQDSFETEWSVRTTVSLKTFIADTPLRLAFLGLKNHCSLHPCFKCEIYHPRNRPFPLPIYSELVRRSSKGVLNDALSNANSVKSKCMLGEIEFDFIEFTVIEVLHAVDFGVVKNYLKLMKTETKAQYYINPDQAALIQARNAQVNESLPSSFTRGSRNFVKFFADLKAFEFRTFILYTCKYRNLFESSSFKHVCLKLKVQTSRLKVLSLRI